MIFETLENLSKYQVLSGVSFVFAKLCSLATVANIFVSMGNASFRNYALWSLALTIFFILMCFVFIGIHLVKESSSNKEKQIEELLKDPEWKLLLQKKLTQC